MKLLIVEDNQKLGKAMAEGFAVFSEITELQVAASSVEAVDSLNSMTPDVILMDVQLNESKNGIELGVILRHDIPRLPIVFYTIQDDDRYFRDFLRSGILTHYAFIRKSNYLLPSMLLPILKDAITGKSFIDPEIAERVHEVRVKDEHDPMSLLEPGEQVVARLLAKGCTNEQIAELLGYRDKRTISRINGQIYTAWGLEQSTDDEKIARTRAAMIVREGRLMKWDQKGNAFVLNESGGYDPWHRIER